MIVGGYVPGVQLLLQAGAQVNYKSDTYYVTPLHLSVSQFFENVAIVELLLKSGAAVNAQDRTGETPLHLISRRLDWSVANRICRLLKKNGADITIKNDKGQVAKDCKMSS